MPRLVHREFDVRVPLESAWEHLARIEAWPSWARHIRSIELDPPGALTERTVGTLRLTNGVRSRFAMTDLRPGERWEWCGDFLWLSVRYDHAFERKGPDVTGLRFDVDVDGWGVGSLGRLFARIYARNLDRAIPNLIAEIEGRDPNPSAAAEPRG